jgi:hypothetical protein
MVATHCSIFFLLSHGNNLSKALYQGTLCSSGSPDALPLIKLLFAGFSDLIIGHITQMGLLVPNAAQGRNLDQIFAHRLPKIRETGETRYLIGAKIIAYCKCLIYIAPFKDVDIK